MRKLNPNTILNGKYIIESIKGEAANMIIYNAFDLVMREAVIIYEFYPKNFVRRLDENDDLLVESDKENQFIKLLARFEENVAQKAKKTSDEFVKNYFRENNTGYLVVSHNIKIAKEKNSKARIILGMLAVIVVVEVGILIWTSNKNLAGNENNSDKKKQQVDEIFQQAENKNKKSSTRKSCSQEELLEIIRNKSGYELFGALKGKNDPVFSDGRDDSLYGKYYYEIPVTDGSMKFFTMPCEDLKSFVCEDFDGDGYNEIFALMRNMNKDYDISLWFSNGEETYDVKENTDYDYGEWYSNCKGIVSHKGLKTIQYGDKKHLESYYYVDYAIAGGYSGDLGANTYCIEDGRIINISTLQSGIVVENGVDDNIIAYNIHDKCQYTANDYGKPYDYVNVWTENESLKNGAYSNILINETQKTDIYYINGKYNEYLAHKATDGELKNINGFDEQIKSVVDTIKQLSFSQNDKVVSMMDIDKPYNVEIDSVYISENDKVYVNMNIECYPDFEESVGSYKENIENFKHVVRANAVFSLVNNSMEFETMYPGFKANTLGCFDR